MSAINFKIPNDENHKFELEILHKRFLVKALLVIGLPTIAFFMINDLIEGRYFVTFLEVFMIIVLITLSLALHKTIEERKEYIIYRICLTLFIILFGTLFIYAIGIEGKFSRTQWSYIYPLLVFLLVDPKEGLFWVLLFSCGIAFFLVYSDFQLIPLEELKTRFLISFFLICIMSYLSAYLVRRNQQKLLDNQGMLKKSENRYREAYNGLKNEIKERKRTEGALRESEEKYRTILENIEDGYYEVDVAGNFTFFNNSMCKILGYPKDELIGMNNRQYMDRETAESVYQVFNKAYATGKPDKGFDWEFMRKDGAKRHVESSISLIKDAKGHRIGFRGIVRDVSERKRGEEQLKNYSQNLENMVEERTVELKKALAGLQNTQSQLLQSEKLASIGQLAAGVAHEINNPVGFVKSNLGTMNEYRQDLTKLLDQYRMLEATLDKEVRENGCIQKALENIQSVKDEIDLGFIMDDYSNVINESFEGMARVSKIVSDLKDFAHVDKAELEHADLNKGIESTLNIVWNELKYKARVIKDLGKIPLVKCYPQRINQVFMNILVNAAQAIEDKGEIRITTRADNGHVDIRISDTGKGIPPDVLPKIFDPFFTTKEVGKGTGLGLSMAYNIIQKHKGTIDVESEVGKGTTFIIRLRTDPDLVE
jgi:PAS domain S-box-containing protein